MAEEVATVLTATQVAQAAADVVLAVATGRVRHDYQGLCPDNVEGPDARDPDCKACNLLVDMAHIGSSAGSDQ